MPHGFVQTIAICFLAQVFTFSMWIYAGWLKYRFLAKYNTRFVPSHSILIYIFRLPFNYSLENHFRFRTTSFFVRTNLLPVPLEISLVTKLSLQWITQSSGPKNSRENVCLGQKAISSINFFLSLNRILWITTCFCSPKHTKYAIQINPAVKPLNYFPLFENSSFNLLLHAKSTAI